MLFHFLNKKQLPTIFPWLLVFKGTSTFLLLSFLFSAIGIGQEYSLVRIGQLVGLADAKGNNIIAAVYENLGWSEGKVQPVEGVIGYQQNGQWGLMTLGEKKITKPLYKSVVPLGAGLIKVGMSRGEGSTVQFGAINAKGEIKLGIQYESLTLANGHFIVSQTIMGEEATGIINHKEIHLVPVAYQTIKAVNEKLFAVTDFDDLTALYNLEGKAVTPFMITAYNEITPQKKHFIFTSNGKLGVFSASGQITVQPLYKSIEYQAPGKLTATHYGSWEALNLAKKQLFAVQTDQIIPISDKLYMVRSGGASLLIDTQGKIIDDFYYDEVAPLDSTYVLVKRSKKYGLKKMDGTRLLPLGYDSIVYDGLLIYGKKTNWEIYTKYGSRLGQDVFEDVIPGNQVLVPVLKDGLWGYIDLSGKTSIPFQFEGAGSFILERAIVQLHGKYGVINPFGQWVVPAEHESINNVHKNLFIAKNGDNWKLISGTNQVVFETYNQLALHDFGILETNSFGKKGLVSPLGRPVFRLQYDSISNKLKDKYFILIRDGYYSLIDQHGKIIIPDYSQYQMIFPFEDEFIGIKKDGKFGYIDLNGTLRIAYQYEGVGMWSENRGPVKIKDKWGFVDRLERLVVQPYYDEVSPYHNGISIVKTYDKFGLINLEGKEVLPLVYNKIVKTKSGDFIVYRNGQAGMATTEGRLVLQPVYDEVIYIGDGLYEVVKDGRHGIKNRQNVDILSVSYDQVGYDPINKIVLIRREGAVETLSID